MLKRTFNYLKKDRAIPCPSGSRWKKVNTLVRDGNNLMLKETGRIDIAEQIASYEDGVSLAKMIERYKRGDTSALNRGSAFYEDVSGYDTDVQIVINNNRTVVSEIGKLKKDPKQEPKQEPVVNSPINEKEGEVNAES